jgi:hypothetical protein
MSPKFHILTQEQMLRKFTDEGWEQKLSAFEYTPKPCGEHKTIKTWHDGAITVGCIRERQYSPSQTVILVCLLRDGDDLYSYDESHFQL